MIYFVNFVLRRSFMIEQSTTYKDGNASIWFNLGSLESLSRSHRRQRQRCGLLESWDCIWTGRIEKGSHTFLIKSSLCFSIICSCSFYRSGRDIPVTLWYVKPGIAYLTYYVIKEIITKSTLLTLDS